MIITLANIQHTRQIQWLLNKHKCQFRIFLNKTFLRLELVLKHVQISFLKTSQKKKIPNTNSYNQYKNPALNLSMCEDRSIDTETDRNGQKGKQNLKIICHMSGVRCHMSHATCCLLHVACHLSSVTCHLTPVTNANSNSQRRSPC